MNIFVLDADPKRAAEHQCDKHVVKMPLETAQMLCTIAANAGFDTPYRSTHKHHPCTLWAGSSAAAFEWLVAHGKALCDEYTRRYSKEHKSRAVIEAMACLPLQLPKTIMPPFAQAMPDQYRHEDPVVAYRAFYRGEKARFATWKTSPPLWWT